MECSTYMFVQTTLILGVIGIAYNYFMKVFKYWKKKDVKYIKPKFPFGTNQDFILMRKSIGDLYADHYSALKGEKIGGLFMVHSPQLMVRDPELIKCFLVKDFDHFHDHGFAADPTFDPLSGNLFMLNGEKWKDMRTKLSPTFTSGKMKMVFHAVAECGVELKDFLKTFAEKEEIFEVKDITTRFTIDVIASCAFGIRSNCMKDPNAEFNYWGKRALGLDIEGLLRNLLYLAVPSLALKFRISMNSKDVEKFFISMVRETVGLRQKHNVRRNDFLQLLINLKNQVCEDGKGKLKNQKGEMTMEQLAAQSVTFLVAGFETSSTTMSFCIYELAVNPEIQKRLCAEIDSVLEKHDGLVTYDSIQEMSYLDRVVSETLRKHPPATFLLRECTKEYKIPGLDVTVDKGTNVIIPVQGLHYDPQYFPEPETFDPERFSETEKSKRHHYSYLPFGEGPRICIGMRFAQMQTKVGLVSLLTNYEFHACEKTTIPLVKDPKSFVNAAKGGIWIQIKKRK